MNASTIGAGPGWSGCSTPATRTARSAPRGTPEVRQLGRTMTRWRHQIAAWHHAHVSNGPTEAANNLIKRVKRMAFGFRRFAHYRIRVLLYAGKPNWELLPTVTPR
jgi:transposase